MEANLPRQYRKNTTPPQFHVMAGSLRIWTMTFVIVLLAIVSLPLSLFSATPFLNVFPDSPRIPGVTYSGESSYTQVYTPSGSQWAPGLDEREVFFASLKHSEDSGTMAARWQRERRRFGFLSIDRDD